VLFGTVFISGISAYPEKSDFASEDFAAVFAGSLTALKKRGKAQVGDKTMIDALEPAVTALWAHRGESVKSAFTAAAEAARAGMEYTKTIPAKFGRARYYGEKAVGIQDPGATSVWLIWRAMATWTENHAV
ncbi:MAG: dihydroxyacetone kinase subunit L, partial [Fusobacteriaceae bacterium]|nr:dihydroxyacetone kinase subunit L [Fusobacteriaceae bacterium]